MDLPIACSYTDSAILLEAKNIENVNYRLFIQRTDKQEFERLMQGNENG